MAWLQPQSTRKGPDTFMQLDPSFAMSRTLARKRRTIHSFPKVFQSGIAEHRVCREPFPLRVLVFQRLQPLGFGYVHAAEFWPSIYRCWHR